MEEIFLKGGYEIRDFHEKADVYVINTCTVTNMADRKSRQMLHRARKKNPKAVIVAAGCYVQTAREAAEADASIDLIIGNNCKGQILFMVESFMEGRTASEESDEKQVNWLDINQNCDYETLSNTPGHTLRFRTAATSFAPIASFLMREGECGVGNRKRFYQKFRHWLLPDTGKSY